MPCLYLSRASLYRIRCVHNSMHMDGEGGGQSTGEMWLGGMRGVILLLWNWKWLFRLLGACFDERAIWVKRERGKEGFFGGGREALVQLVRHKHPLLWRSSYASSLVTGSHVYSLVAVSLGGCDIQHFSKLLQVLVAVISNVSLNSCKSWWLWYPTLC
jgi:hypothetical protein